MTRFTFIIAKFRYWFSGAAATARLVREIEATVT
jgi:hypothetical protein